MAVRTCECGCGGPTTLAKRTDPRHGAIEGQPLRFLPGHHSRKSSVEYVADPDTGCWEWQLARFTNGYGRILHDQGAHRLYYERYKGQIPDGLHIDHLCRNRGCVNPDHMEAVEPGENARRAHAKLTADDVRSIRVRLDSGWVTQDEIAREYGLKRQTISDVWVRRNWAHV